jgi:hypothetical protein
MKENHMKALEEDEDKIIRKAMKEHRVLDPREDRKRHAQLLLTEYNGQIYRRFIVNCIELTADHLSESQVRLVVADEKYCRQELGPLIDKDGLNYLPFVRAGTSNFWDIENGHHRVHYILHIRQDGTIAVFVVGCTSYKMNKDGTYDDGVDSAYLNLIAGVRSNPPPVNKAYTCVDAAVQVAEAFKIDSTFGGLNPSGKFPERPGPGKLHVAFEALMDHLHPNQFLEKQSRGRIFNLWDSHRDGSKINNVTFADITNILVTNDYDTGIKKSPRAGKLIRKNFLEHYDENRKAYIAITDTNGKNFEASICSALIKAYHNKELYGDENHEIVVVCEIYKPKTTMTGLSKQRRTAVTNISEWDSIIRDTMGLPFGFTTIIFPKQLTSRSDNGRTVLLSEDEANNVLKFEKNKEEGLA